MSQYTLYLYVDEEELLKGCLKAIFEDNTEFVQQMNLYVLNGTNDESVKKQLKKYEDTCENRIHYISCEGQKIEAAYKAALKEYSGREGDYVGFIKASTLYRPNTLKKIVEQAKKNPDMPIAFAPQYKNRKGTLIEYLKFDEPRNVCIKVNEKCTWYNPYLGAYFFPAQLVSKVEINENLSYEGLMDFCMRLVDMAGAYYLLKETVFIKEDLETDPYNYPPLYEKTWYQEHVEQYMLPILSQNPDRFVQFAMFYSICAKFAGNMNDRNKALFTKEEKDAFYESVRNALQFIDDDVILYSDDLVMRRLFPRHMCYHMYEFKYYGKKKNITFEKTELDTLVRVEGTPVELLSFMDMRVDAINNQKSTLQIYASLKNIACLDYEKIKVYAVIGKERIQGVRTEIYSLVKFFGESVHKDYTFELQIDKKLLKGNTHIQMRLVYEKNEFPLSVSFAKPQSRLWGECPGSYWRFDKKYLSYNSSKKEFNITNRNIFTGIAKEVGFWFGAIKYGEEKNRSYKSILLRLAYFATKPYYGKKDIWITYDQLFKGGDNGEYFYRYVSERKDKGNVEIYYVANKDSKEYKELNAKYGTVLAFNSFKHKLVSLHANHVFATRVAFNVYLGFWKLTGQYFRDMFNAEIFCLQHGLTIQKIAQYQNRLFDNTKLYFCVSPVEMDNLRNPVYGYEEKELILTGAPRYDGLVSQDKRYILISPTWRRNVTSGTNKKGSNHDYSPNFKNTEYFKIYNSLINDKKLIEYAKKYNYKLIYLIHPILSPQLKDYTTNDYVEIIPGAGDVSYEKILSEASLMLTDHSGVQFDFAYMRKPLVYYHPDTLPPQYDEGGLKYEINGFGPVCKNHEQVVDALCDYMANNCVIKDMYKERVEKFFGYDDRNNCERVYEAAMKYIREEEHK